MKVYIHPLNSCGMRNTVIQSYRDFLTGNGHLVLDRPDQSDLILIWSCAFRGDVRDYSIREIERLVGLGSGEVVVAGCLPDIDRDFLLHHFEGRMLPWRDQEIQLERIFGSAGKKLVEVPLVLIKKQLYQNEAQYRREHPDSDVPYVGRFIQLYISEGCPWECTYCSERLAFPKYRSFSEKAIVAQCCAEVEKSGCREVVLLGDSVGDYGCDTGGSLPQLIRHLRSEIPGLRLGLQDFNPCHFLRFRQDMVEFIRDGMIAHLQMPFQSASDRILKLMRRPYTQADLRVAFGTLNDLKFTEVDSHMIVGFPGESDAEFDESIAFALQVHPKYMLVNSFLETPGMPAAALPDKVPFQVKKQRLARARERFVAAGILCNCDESDLACERFRRMSTT